MEDCQMNLDWLIRKMVVDDAKKVNFFSLIIQDVSNNLQMYSLIYLCII